MWRFMVLAQLVCWLLLSADARCLADFYGRSPSLSSEFRTSTYGVIPVNFDEVDAAEFIIQNTTGYRGVDAVIDAVGFEAKGSMLETVMTNLKLEGSSGSAATLMVMWQSAAAVW